MFWFGIPHFYHNESGFVQNYFVYVLFTFCSPYVSNSHFVHLLFTPNRTEREQNVNLIFYDIRPTKHRLGLLRGLPAPPSTYWLLIPFWHMRMRPILYIIGDKLRLIPCYSTCNCRLLFIGAFCYGFGIWGLPDARIAPIVFLTASGNPAPPTFFWGFPWTFFFFFLPLF